MCSRHKTRLCPKKCQLRVLSQRLGERSNTPQTHVKGRFTSWKFARVCCRISNWSQRLIARNSRHDKAHKYVEVIQGTVSFEVSKLKTYFKKRKQSIQKREKNECGILSSGKEKISNFRTEQLFPPCDFFLKHYFVLQSTVLQMGFFCLIVMSI